jgi:isoquinoline 1-oxidoreductase beta subunit
MPYRISHRHHERHDAKTHIPSSTRRAPGANQLGFMAEVFVDEMTQ